MKREICGSIVAIGALVVCLAQPIGAQASEGDHDGSGSKIGGATMTVGGFDADVAAKNGFQITVDADGNQESVPVSDSAKALVAAAEQAGHVDLGRIGGRCGSSWLEMARAGGSSVYFNTGYSVYLPSLWHNWAVDIFSSHGGYSFGLDGGPSAPTWDDGWTTNVGNSSGTHGNVRPGSLAVLTNGDVCYSGSPTSGT